MLDTETKRRIDSARDILVGKIPDPKSQVEQITIALIYKFMDDMDRQAENLPRGKAKFFTNEYKKYAWRNIFSPQNSGQEIVNLYGEALQNMNFNKNVPQLFRDIFKNAYLPYRDPETLKDFLKEINVFEYDHSERLGDAFEYLLSVLGSQGDAGQFRTPRNIIDFMVEIIEPKKNERILDPACGTAGFLISAYKHIVKRNSKNYDPKNDPKPFELQDVKLSELTINGKGYKGEKLTSDNRKRLIENISGYDISPDMVRLSLVNMYLHGFSNPHIAEYDTLSRDEKWDEKAEVILANPPFMSPRGGIKPHSRFSVQSKRSEVLFVDYMAEHLTPQGRAAIIVPEGIIFQTATAYKQLRKMLVDENFLVGVISLPAGLFNPYSGVKTSIIWLDKTLSKKTDKILFVKIENDGFDLGAQRRPIKKNDLPDAYQAIMEYKETLLDGKGFDCDRWQNISLVEKNKIAKAGEYNLSGERYNIGKDLSSIKFRIISVGDIFETASGGTPLKNRSDYYQNGTIPWLRSGEVSQGYIYSAENYITEEALKKSSAKIFPQNTVLVAMYGATAGQVGILKFEAATNQAICGIYPNDTAIPEYIYLILKSQKDHLISLSSGGAQPNISQKIVRDLKIPLPPLSIQQEIVAELDSYQKVIDGARQVVENYKPHIDINPDWKMVELGEVCKPEYGFTERAKEKGDVRFVRITDIGQDGKLINDEKKYIDLTATAKKYLLKKGDILVARTGATFGKTMMFNEDYKAVFASFLIRLVFSSKIIIPDYYWVFAQSQSYWDQANSLMTGGGQPQFNGNAIKKIKLPIPNIDSQREIVVQVEQEQKIIDANKQLVEMYEKKVKDRISKVWGEK